MNLRSLFIKIYLLLGLLLGACFKNEDNTALAPKASLFIGHFCTGAPALSLFLNGSTQSQPIVYGTSNATANSFYQPNDAGIQQMLLKAGNSILLDKNISLNAGTFYSLFYVDSFKNNRVSTILIKEDTTTVDTLAKARWLHLKPGNDLLSAALVNIKDTSVLAFNTSYLNSLINNQNVPAVPFNTLIKPGIYRLDLFKGSTFISSTNNINMEAGTLYSFVASDSASQAFVKIFKHK